MSTSLPRNPLIVKHTSLSTDQVWSRLMQLMDSQHLVACDTDQSRGYMLTDTLSFISSYRIDSISTDSSAYRVVQRQTAYQWNIEPSYITGYIKVHILPGDSTTIILSIEDLKNYRVEWRHYRFSSSRYEIKAKAVSTQLLEHTIARYLAVDTAAMPLLHIRQGVVNNPKDNYHLYTRKYNTIFLSSYLSAFTVFMTTLVVGFSQIHPKK